MARRPKPSGTRRRPKTLVDLLAELDRLGIKVERRRAGHLVVHAPEGQVIMAASPSCSRAIANVVSELRRHGVEI